MSTITLDRPATPLRAAAATPPAPRLDFYEPIHKALRAEMCAVLVALGTLDVADQADCAATLGRTRALLDLLMQHLVHENSFVHPALEAAVPGSSAHAHGEHQAHRASIEALRAQAAALQPASAANAAAAQRLYRGFALFMAENLVHMNDEETVHNAQLWAAYSDAELHALHLQLQASIPPAEMAQVLPLLMKALNPVQRAEVLAGLRADAPPEALPGALALAQQVLDAAAWAKLARALGLPPVPGLVRA